jgi:hypothetical protein
MREEVGRAHGTPILAEPGHRRVKPPKVLDRPAGGCIQGAATPMATLAPLIQDEIAASAAYRLAAELAAAERGPEDQGKRAIAEALRRLGDAHLEALNLLLPYASARTSAAVHNVDAWTWFPDALAVTGSWTGNAAALRTLLEGEAGGTAAYERVAADESLDQGVRHLIQGGILPRQRRHVWALSLLG